MVTITQVCIGGDVCVRVWGQSRKGERQCVFTPRLCVLSEYTLKTEEINGGGKELSLETIGQTSQTGYQGLRESIHPTEEKL